MRNSKAPFSIGKALALWALTVCVGTMIAVVAQANPTCVTGREAMEELLMGSSGWAIENVADVEGQDAQAIIDLFDSLPPVGQTDGDEVIVVRATNKTTGSVHSNAMVIILNKGCAVMRGPVPWNRLGDLLPRDS